MSLVNIIVTFFASDASVRTNYWDHVNYTLGENQTDELLVKDNGLVIRTFQSEEWISYQVTQA